MDKFQDKITIITGGASGIGRAIAQNLAKKGAILILADRNGSLAIQTAEAINKSGGKAEAVTVDVTNAEAVKKLITDTVAQHGRIDYLFNNAGIAISAETHELTLDDWYRTFDVNLRGVVHGVHAVYPIMIEQGFGHIVNTASVAGLTPIPFLTAYAATKHAVVGLSVSLRAEAASLGVKVSVVCPGIIDTPLIDNMEIKDEDEMIFADRRDMIKKTIYRAYPVEKCAQVITQGVGRNKPIITVTATGKLYWWAYRICPPVGIALAKISVWLVRNKFKTQK